MAGPTPHTRRAEFNSRRADSSSRGTLPKQNTATRPTPKRPRARDGDLYGDGAATGRASSTGRTPSTGLLGPGTAARRGGGGGGGACAPAVAVAAAAGAAPCSPDGCVRTSKRFLSEVSLCMRCTGRAWKEASVRAGERERGTREERSPLLALSHPPRTTLPPPPSESITEPGVGSLAPSSGRRRRRRRRVVVRRGHGLTRHGRDARAGHGDAGRWCAVAPPPPHPLARRRRRARLGAAAVCVALPRLRPLCQRGDGAAGGRRRTRPVTCRPAHGPAAGWRWRRWWRRAPGRLALVARLALPARRGSSSSSSHARPRTHHGRRPA
jgi:hypothetical protein